MYQKKPETITVTWLDGYSDTLIKQKTGISKPDSILTTKEEVEALGVTYPNDPTREGYYFTKWGDPKTDGDGNITITAERKELTYKVEWYIVGTDDPVKTATRTGTIGEKVEVSDEDKSYGGNDYAYGSASPESITLTESGQNIITLRYYRTTSGRRDPEPTPTPPRRNPDPTTEPDPDPSTDPAPNPTTAPSPIPSLVPGVPTVDILGTNVPLTNLPDEDVPLAGTPKKAEGLGVDIFDEEVPLSDVPKTGDISDLWYLAALLSAGMLILLGLRRKNHR